MLSSGVYICPSSQYKGFHSSPLSISLPRKEQMESLKRPTSNVVHKTTFDVSIKGSQAFTNQPSSMQFLTNLSFSDKIVPRM